MRSTTVTQDEVLAAIEAAKQAWLRGTLTLTELDDEQEQAIADYGSTSPRSQYIAAYDPSAPA